jgi:hypothetical protein
MRRSSQAAHAPKAAILALRRALERRELRSEAIVRRDRQGACEAAGEQRGVDEAPVAEALDVGE